MGTKYDRLFGAAKTAPDSQNVPIPPFDFRRLAPKRWRDRIVQRLTELILPLWLWFARIFKPIVWFGGFYWITRREDVLDILADHENFRVPYGPEMMELARGTDGEATFVLGLDGPAQERQNAIIRSIILPQDMARIGAWSSTFAESLISGGAGRLDVVSDFAIRIPTEICRRYFGLSFTDPNRFAEWSIAVSALLFADPTGDPVKREVGLAGAAHLRRVIDIAIRRALAEESSLRLKESELTVVERLVLARQQHGMDTPEIRAIVLGLVVGFIPTNGLAAAKIFERIFANPATVRAASEAARAAEGIVPNGDPLRDILLEAARLSPALAPGQWRVAAKDVVVGRGTSYERTIPKGATVMVSTMSALRDTAAGAASPFDTQLLFGHATHKCLGQHLALRIILDMSRVLFRQADLAPARGRYGRMQRVGYFPHRLDVVYRSPAASQSMVICCIPVKPGIAQATVEQHVQALGNPASPHVAQSLEQTGIVHFASASVVNANDGEGDEPPSLQLLLEFNVDGDKASAIQTIADQTSAWLDPLIRSVVTGDKPFGQVLTEHSLDLHFWPWGPTGLNFHGTPGLSVERIAMQARLRSETEAQLKAIQGQDVPVTGGKSFGARPMSVLTAVRQAYRSQPGHGDLDAFLVQPSRREFLPSKWRKPTSRLAPLWNVAMSRTGLAVLAVALASWGLNTWLCHTILVRAGLNAGPGFWGQAATHLVSGGLGLVLSLLFWVTAAAAAYGVFRWVEAQESPSDLAPDPGELRAIMACENAPSHQQNHIIAVTLLKGGLVRRLSFAFALWGIAQSLNWFRPGFVVTMGTIHFAKWFRMPNSRKMIFQSNYDGSWESYLEDFITRAHPGQTAAWSNGVGFPRSKGLVGEGARDGDRFKRWVRRQQIPTAFWYSRFPELTTSQIRANALIHEGLSRGYTETAARSWIDLFGSMQRQPYELEGPEIQTIVFRGLKRALYTAYLPIRLPGEDGPRGLWLDRLKDRLAFGKFAGRETAIYFGISSAGLRKLAPAGRGAGSADDFLGSFPAAFVDGMRSRARILRDPDQPLRWSDAEGGKQPSPVADAVVIVYAPTAKVLSDMVEKERQELGDHGGEVVHGIIRTVSLDDKGRVRSEPSLHVYEHFGFRDGISGPVIRGAEQFRPGSGERDVVEPGEFVLGYRNNQGYFAPGILVPAESDTDENLPISTAMVPYGFADFQGADEQFSARDLGRNGTFMVIRQLNQDAQGFKHFAKDRAAWLRKEYGRRQLRTIVGENVTGKWFAAKMMGRWQDGRPLVLSPTARDQFRSSKGSARPPANDFRYGQDDPRGHGCPLGAHIRRVNPRDSMEPDDPLEETITRRHQLLRRGRSYFYDPATETYPVEKPREKCETGMLFVALCSDLERQFELVQQTWLGSTSFHGLVNEPDPIAATTPGQRNFTIPTPAGPLIVRDMKSFVELKGGGYFFVPSRSAMNYFASFDRRDP